MATRTCSRSQAAAPWSRGASSAQDQVAEEVEIVGLRDTQKSVGDRAWNVRKLLDEGVAGRQCGCLLRGIDKEAVERGQVLLQAGR